MATTSTTDDKPTKNKTKVPPGAKVPQDHQQPAPKPDADGNLYLEVRGVKLTISADALDDFELLDDLNELEQNQAPGRLPSVLRRLIGEQWREVMDSLRGDNGRVSVEDGSRFVSEVLEAANPNS